MAIAFVSQTPLVTAASGGAATVTFASAPPANSLVLIRIGAASTSSSDFGGTQIVYDGNGGSDGTPGSGTIQYFIGDGSKTSWTSVSAATAKWGAVGACFTGIDLSTLAAAQNTSVKNISSVSTTPWPAGPITPSTIGSLIVAGVKSNGTATMTLSNTGNTFTELNSIVTTGGSAASNANARWAYSIVTSTSATTRTWTPSSSGAYGGFETEFFATVSGGAVVAKRRIGKYTF